MPSPPITHPKVGVVADPEVLADFDESVFADGIYSRQAPGEDLEHTLERFLDDQCDVVAVLGGDALVGGLLGVYRRRLRRHATPLRLFVLEAGAQSVLGRALDAPELSPKAFRKLKSALLDGRLNRRLVPTIKVSSSARPAADYGFSFGAGLFYRLFEAYHRAGPSAVGAVAGTLGRLARDMLLEGATLRPTPARVSVDRRPAEESVGYLLASSLETSWLGLSLLSERGASYRMGASGRELLKEVAKSRALPRFLDTGASAESFDTIHMDWSGGYVLDGELYEPAHPYVVQLTEGPLAHFVTL
ncbi:MAG: hypothetical protein ACLFVJ_02060 [Persicimonas sp.]